MISEDEYKNRVRANRNGGPRYTEGMSDYQKRNFDVDVRSGASMNDQGSGLDISDMTYKEKFTIFGLLALVIIIGFSIWFAYLYFNRDRRNEVYDGIAKAGPVTVPYYGDDAIVITTNYTNVYAQSGKKIAELQHYLPLKEVYKRYFDTTKKRNGMIYVNLPALDPKRPFIFNEANNKKESELAGKGGWIKLQDIDTMSVSKESFADGELDRTVYHREEKFQNIAD